MTKETCSIPKQQVIGMTLRDWFAGQALIGLLSSTPDDLTIEIFTEYSYKYADAMLKARGE